MRRSWPSMGLVLVVACTPSAGGSDAGCQETEDYGAVMIELGRLATETSNPYEGTKYVQASLDYLACLEDYYADNPDQLPFEDAGQPIFTEWLEDGRLCDAAAYPDEPPLTACFVDAYTWNEAESGTDGLWLSYSFEGDDIENRYLPYGLLPTTALVDCTPLVELSEMNVVGLDAQGEQVWRIAGLSNAVARSNQTGPIEIFVERLP